MCDRGAIVAAGSAWAGRARRRSDSASWRHTTPACAVDHAFEPLLTTAVDAGFETRLARIVRTPQEAARRVPLSLDVTEDAVLPHDPDGFFAGVLDGMRRSLARLGANRSWPGKTWYWDLKPDFRPGDAIEI